MPRKTGLSETNPLKVPRQVIRIAKYREPHRFASQNGTERDKPTEGSAAGNSHSEIPGASPINEKCIATAPVSVNPVPKTCCFEGTQFSLPILYEGSTNRNSYCRFNETAAAIKKDGEIDHNSLRELRLVILDGENSNQFSEVFDELSRWNEVLKDTSLNQKPPSP